MPKLYSHDLGDGVQMIANTEGIAFGYVMQRTRLVYAGMTDRIKSENLEWYYQLLDQNDQWQHGGKECIDAVKKLVLAYYQLS